MSEPRLQLAENLLMEAVYQARARQAAGVSLTGHKLQDPAPTDGCGMGDKPEAAIRTATASLEEVLGLSERGSELLRELWPNSLTSMAASRVRDMMQEWIERQDALDRKRNHYLRDFRQAHGFDRRSYSSDIARNFEQGLERINADINDRLRRAAHELLRAVP